MQTQSEKKQNRRRNFLKLSGLGIAGTLLNAATNVPYVHAAENNTLNIALVGCGGRGGGAVMQALSTEGPKKVVALADVFENKAKLLLPDIKAKFPNEADANVLQIGGFEGYKQAIDAVGPGGVVLLAAPPAFRPLHVEYAVNKGVHVFMEKSFGVDAPGVRRILKAGELAKTKNLKVVGGLMTRHSAPSQQAVHQLHRGIIGERITCWAYREHNQVPFSPRRDGESIISHQIRNYSNFTWLNGSFLLDWLIHELDICCWAKDAYPVSAQGMGGRQVRTAKDQLFDHYAVEYTFADGTRLVAQARHQDNTWGCEQSTIHGQTGCAVMGTAGSTPRIYRGHNPNAANMIWEYTDSPVGSPYQVEHDVLFDCIRNDKPINEAERCGFSTMVGILGRMAAETGQLITWDDAMNSAAELAPNLDKLTMDGPAPVMPDDNGNYPIAMPGTA